MSHVRSMGLQIHVFCRICTCCTFTIIYLYILILYIDTCLSLSLCILSCIYNDEAQVSQNLSVSASSAGGHGLYLGILQELQGLRADRLSDAFRATQHTSSYINTSQFKESELPALCQSPKALGVHFHSFSNSLYLRVLEPALVRTVNQYIGDA